MASFLDFLNKDKVSLSNRIYIYPDIPREKAVNAIRKMSDGVAVYYEDVRVLIDTTLLGSGKSGVMITDTHIFLRADFDNPICRSVDDIFSIEAKKSLFGLPIIYINDKKILKLENMDSPPVEYIIQCFSNYIEYLDEEPDEELDDDEAEALLEEILKELPPEKREITGELLRQGRLAKSQEEVDKLKEVMELYVESSESNDSEIKKLISGYKSASSTKEKYLLIDMMKRNIEFVNDNDIEDEVEESILNVYNQDNFIAIYKHIRSSEMKMLFGTINFFIDDPIRDIKNHICKCILDNSIYIRENYFERLGVRGFLNDFSLFDTTVYITTLLWNELDNRKIEHKQIKNMLYEGVNLFFDKKPNFVNNIIGVSEDSVSYPSAFDYTVSERKEKLTNIYYARLALSNLNGRFISSLPNELEKLDAKKFEDNLFSTHFFELLHIIEREARANDEVINSYRKRLIEIDKEFAFIIFVTAMPILHITEGISQIVRDEINFDLSKDTKLHRNIELTCDNIYDLIQKIK